MDRPGRPVHVPPLLWNLGDVFLSQSTREFLDQTVVIEPINLWTFVHSLSGIAVATFVTTDPFLFQMIHVSWELFQLAIGMTQASEPIEIADIIIDTVAYNAGLLFF